MADARTPDAGADLLERVRPALGERAVVLLSGGRDSVCLLDCAARACERVVALHVNYGLRPGAEGDEALCRELCERLRVELVVERPGRPEGNLQAWARDRRYEAGVRLARERHADLLSGHTASDQVETVLYRLAASPGRRALLGMRVREGGLVRPLLGCTREETAAHCRARGLSWREDPSNDDPAFARNRVRHFLVPRFRELHPAAERNLLETVATLNDESEVLAATVDDALAAAGWDGEGAVDAAGLRRLPAALRRLAFQRMADVASQGAAPAVGRRADEALALSGGTKSLDLGGGLRAVMSYGRLRVEAVKAPVPAPAAARLPVPGAVAFGGGRITARIVADGELDAAALGPEVEVRCWRPGDRMRPAGLDGTKTLQDLFVDRKVASDVRRRVPVVVARGEIAWVAGVATGERFRATEGSGVRASLAWVGLTR